MPDPVRVNKSLPVGPTPMEVIQSQLGEIKALLYKQVVPTLAKVQRDLADVTPQTDHEGLHSLFVRLAEQVKAVQPGSPVVPTQDTLRPVLSTLERVEQRLMQLEMKIGAASLHSTHQVAPLQAQPGTPIFIPSDLVRSGEVKGSKIKVTEVKDTSDLSEATEALRRVNAKA